VYQKRSISLFEGLSFFGAGKQIYPTKNSAGLSLGTLEPLVLWGFGPVPEGRVELTISTNLWMGASRHVPIGENSSSHHGSGRRVAWKMMNLVSKMVNFYFHDWFFRKSTHFRMEKLN